MRAVTFDVSIPRYLVAKTLGRFTDAAFYGAPSGVRLTEVSAPSLPGDRWVRIEILQCGICGSDVGNLTFASSPAMEPFGSFPAVLGHEILGRVVEVGSAVTRVEVGQRVAVDVMISCEVRGYSHDAQCRSCRSGRHATCEKAGEEGPLVIDGSPMRPGLTQGYHASLPGGWGEETIAHETQLFPISDEIEDRRGVLTEPLSIGVHAALNARAAHPDEPVLVIGSGPIALGTIWAIRATGFTGEIVAQTKRKREAELARAFGATTVVKPGEEARDALLDTGARAYSPIMGDEVYAGGGFPLVFDCVGSGQTLSQALRYATPRGRIVMLGCAHEIPKLDLTFTWARELSITGFVGYGVERFRGTKVHTYDATLELMRESSAPLDQMVTHVYPLAEYRTALSAAGNRRRSGSIKVLLDPRQG
ncbi:MAG: zinc-binding dehydrogenase [Longimicrobiales bacterium]|nr:zinc-binding dehydrogenase [Longimicrobiales bacterium]